MTQFTINQELYRVNSYYWQGMVYIVLEPGDEKTLCKIKGSKSKPKYIPNKHLSTTMVDFKNIP